jgi:ribosomal protein S18 acetylase RimI-like enzyme
VTAAFVIEPLGPGHDRTAFRCGVEPLDHYFRHQAGQDVRRRIAACRVAVEADTGRVAGFYTLSAGGIPLPDLPAGMARRLPRYPSVPVARLGRLAVDRAFQGRALGAALLWNAIATAARSDLAAFALVVDAKDDAAAGFYRHHGFVGFGSVPGCLILPLAGVVERAGKG